MLILVRHGETALNLDRRLQGRIDEPLNASGERQAAAVGAYLGQLDAVVSSPLRRALSTAEALQLPVGASVEIDDRWIELDYGEYEGCELGPATAGLWERWHADEGYRPTGGESLQDVAARVNSALPELFERAAVEDVAVVTHVSPLKAAIAAVLEAPPSIAWRTHLATAAICRIDVATGTPVMTTFNEAPPSLRADRNAVEQRG